MPIDVRPLKGQILRLQAPGPPVDCSVGWGHNYATTKTDGLLWAGTTEEEAGFDEESTTAARDEIGAALVKMLPAMADAQIAHQTACLRPVASDGLLVLGRVPGLEHRLRGDRRRPQGHPLRSRHGTRDRRSHPRS